MIYNLIFVLLFSSAIAVNVDYDGVIVIQLFHALNTDLEPTFTERGNVTFNSVRFGNALVNNHILKPDEKDKLQDLIKNGEIYRMKALITNIDGSSSELYTFLKACMLGESNLVDKLTISLDYVGIVSGIHLNVPDALPCRTSDAFITKNKFTTSIYVQHTEQGAIPDTASYIQKIEKEKESRERGEVKDNRSFLAKYWMYIVPALIFFAFTSATNQEAGAAGGGR